MTVCRHGIPSYVTPPCEECQQDVIKWYGPKKENKKMTKTATVYMELSKLTKGAVQYKEPSLEGNTRYLIGTLYLRKLGMNFEDLAEHPEYPAHIKITVEIVE